jgi:hypothetical protein
VAAVRREGDPQERCASTHVTVVRACVKHDDPCADRRRLPPELRGDPRSQANASAHALDETLRVDDGGLQLDDEQAPRLRVPGQDVDDASLTVDGEAHLRSPRPAHQGAEITSQFLVKACVRLVDDTIKVAAAPARPNVQADALRGGDGAARLERDASEPSVLKPTDDLALDPSPPCDVGLAKAGPDADDTDDRSDAHVVHAQEHGDRVFTRASR